MEAEQYRRRSVNERLRGLNEPFALLLGTYEVACECGDTSCAELIVIPADVYTSVRTTDDAIVHPQHVRGAAIVSSRDGWAIVQK